MSANTASALLAPNEEGRVTELGILRPGPVPKQGDPAVRSVRTHYSEHEVHSSQATIQEDDLPSVRIDRSPRMTT